VKFSVENRFRYYHIRETELINKRTGTLAEHQNYVKNPMFMKDAKEFVALYKYRRIKE